MNSVMNLVTYGWIYFDCFISVNLEWKIIEFDL